MGLVGAQAAVFRIVSRDVTVLLQLKSPFRRAYSYVSALRARATADPATAKSQKPKGASAAKLDWRLLMAGIAKGNPNSG
jgi:hypothetical protein